MHGTDAKSVQPVLIFFFSASCCTDVIAPTPWSDAPSVQLVLKTCFLAAWHALWSIVRWIHRELFLDHQFNRCHCYFLSWSSSALSNALIPLRRFIRWPSVRPVHGHRLNRCYCFCIHLSNLSWWSFGHLKNILSLLFFYYGLASLRWLGHIFTANWTY